MERITPGFPIVYFCDISQLVVDSILSTLTDEEINRSKTFLHHSDKHQYISSKWLVRQVLGNILQVAPSDINIGYTPNGQPILLNDTTLKYSLAHTGNIAVVGVSKNNLIGIDIEQSDRSFEEGKLASFLFSDRELELYSKLQPFKKQQAFINCWTRKEALLKALGKGFTESPKNFTVGFANENVAQNNNTTRLPYGEHVWTLDTREICTNYTVTTAVDGHLKNLNYIHFETKIV